MRPSESENTPGQLSRIRFTASTEVSSCLASSVRWTGCPSASRRYKSKDNRCSSKFRLGKHLTMLAANSSRFSFEGVAILPPYRQQLLSDLGRGDLQIPPAVSSFARDAAEAALARRVFYFASAIAGFHFCRNPLSDRGAARFGNLFMNVSAGEAKAIANRDRVRGLLNTHAH